MNRLLLLGAGFTRNWGGWLANEVTEHLLGAPHLDAAHRELLIAKRRDGGFEANLGVLRAEYARSKSASAQQRMRAFEAALYSMFEDMNTGLGAATFEFQNQLSMMARSCLIQFDAIFTLNQDILLEQHYLNDNVLLGSNGKWTGWHLPGLKRGVADYGMYNDGRVSWMMHDPTQHKIHPGISPTLSSMDPPTGMAKMENGC